MVGRLPVSITTSWNLSPSSNYQGRALSLFQHLSPLGPNGCKILAHPGGCGAKAGPENTLTVFLGIGGEALRPGDPQEAP